MSGATPMTQSEFDQLATFVAVADELSMEPFISEDNHEKLSRFKDASSGCDRFVAVFCHPAFLKSALMTFRKLWLESEPCEFQKIRDLVFTKHPDQSQLLGFRPWYYEMHSQRLDAPAASEWAKESRKDILDIWIYTQAVHAGPKQLKKGKTWGFKLEEFDEWSERIGREKFEYLFRSSLREVASVYVEFLRRIARPLFVLLQRDFKMVPGFEAAAALKYNPYPDPRYGIVFDDVFWHLDKESMEETFERLLERHTYAILDNFCRSYFESKAEALAAVCESDSFATLLVNTGAVLLGKDDTADDLQLRYSGHAIWGTPFGPVKFDVYRGKRVRLLDDTEKKFAEAYSIFRKCLFEERKRQRRQPGSDNSWQ